MSLIHEALKKAEEQRRLGQPPDLTSPFSRPRERQPLLPFLLVAIVIAGGAGWWLLRTPATTNATKSADTSAATKATPAGSAPSNLAGPQDNASAGGLERIAARSSSAERQPVAPAPPAPPPMSLPAPNAGAPKVAPATLPSPTKLASGETAAASPDARAAQGREKVAALEGSSGQAAPDPEALKQAMDRAANVAVSTTPLNPATKADGPVKVNKVPMPDTGPTKPGTAATKPIASSAPSAPPPEVAPAQGTKKPELPESEPVTGPTLNPPTSTPGTDAPTDNLPLFWQLPYATRKDLPQLAMSMHVYSSDPGKRFIVINGDHKSEGDPIGADVFVREIRSDGVVMEFRGQRFLVPRGGS